MPKVLLAAALIFTFAVSGCKKGVKPETENPAAQDSTISSEAMDFDLSGSDSGKIAGLKTINFEYDKARITAEGKEIAKGNAAWAKSHPNTVIAVEGHCDRHGSIEYNLALGERRAKTVKDYLVNLGVEASRLKTLSYGKEKQLDTAETDAADAKNRRANFVVSK